jgi:hypothetical protein
MPEFRTLPRKGFQPIEYELHNILLGTVVLQEDSGAF